MPKDIHTQDSSQQRTSISDIVNLVESVSLTRAIHTPCSGSAA